MAEAPGPHRARKHRKLTYCLPRVQGAEACRPASVAAERQVQAALPPHVWRMLTLGCGRNVAVQGRSSPSPTIEAGMLCRTATDRKRKSVVGALAQDCRWIGRPAVADPVTEQFSTRSVWNNDNPAPPNLPLRGRAPEATQGADTAHRFDCGLIIPPAPAWRAAAHWRQRSGARVRHPRSRCAKSRLCTAQRSSRRVRCAPHTSRHARRR